VRRLLAAYRKLLFNYDSVLAYSVLGVPAGGAALLGCAYTLLKPQDRETGIVHVLSSMHSHYSILPLRNAIVQFIGGVFSLATGQSGGREGPGVHLGAAVNSLLGQRLGLPNNSLRMLIACGTAGGIAAAFQTPLAGVLFAMEVIIAEYTVVGLIPIILAAVSASAVSHALTTDEWLFRLSAMELNSLLELPYVILIGLCCGAAVAAFIRITKFSASFSQLPVALRFTVAGLLTGSLALLVPETLGLGYDTLSLAMHGELGLSALLFIAACKLLATAVSCGVGMPVGLIGPNLLSGACIGGMLGVIGGALLPDLASDPTLYAVIGMGATMGAVLNAPLAAILAVMEMTQSPITKHQYGCDARHRNCNAYQQWPVRHALGTPHYAASAATGDPARSTQSATAQNQCLLHDGHQSGESATATDAIRPRTAARIYSAVVPGGEGWRRPLSGEWCQTAGVAEGRSV